MDQWHSQYSEKFANNRGKSGKNQEKEDNSGRKGKNLEGSFMLPLLADMVGHASDMDPFTPPQKTHLNLPQRGVWIIKGIATSITLKKWGESKLEL